MATKGAQVFRLRKKEYAERWLRNLNIKHYEPSLQNLNFDFEPDSEASHIQPSEGASISELPDTNSQLATKRLPDESWQMAQKLSQILAKSVPRTKTPTPFKFNGYLQEVYEREQTPSLSRHTSIAHGTRSHDAEPTAENSPTPHVHSEQKTSRKRIRAESTSAHIDNNSIPGTNDGDSNNGNSTQRPTKKSKQADGGQTQTKKRTTDDKRTPPHSTTSSVNISDKPAQATLIRKPIAFDWDTTIPQALVLDFSPKNEHVPKIGVWFLPNLMVSLLRIFFHMILTSLSGSQQKNFGKNPLHKPDLLHFLAD